MGNFGLLRTMAGELENVIGNITNVGKTGKSKKGKSVGKSKLVNPIESRGTMVNEIAASFAKSVESIFTAKPGKIIDKKDIRDLVVRTFDKFIPRVSGPKTTTKLALGAIDQLERANPNVVKEAITTIRNKNIPGTNLMDYLEDKLNSKAFNEVFTELADGWSDSTIKTFASPQVLQMEPNKQDVMDSIVSIAILNDSDLENEVRIENIPETTDDDLLENRKIVWQHPPPGTPLDPPYVILVAVEHQDTAQMEDIVESIMEELGVYQGVKLPKTAIARLTKGFQAVNARLFRPTMNRTLLAAKDLRI